MAENFDDAETLILGAEAAAGPTEAADGLLDLLEEKPESSTATIPGVISGDISDAASKEAATEPEKVPEKLEEPKVDLPDPVEAGKGVKRAATLTLDMQEDPLPDTGAGLGIDDENTGVLSSTNPSTAKDIWLGAAVTSVGRDESNGIILDDPRVSGEQFRVHRKVDSDGIPEYELEDCSRNGTLLNKKLLHKDGTQRACLKDQDLLEVLPSSKVGQAAAISFLFHAPAAAASLRKKRRLTEGAGSKSDLDAEQIFSEATCAICQEVMHRATSVQPCVHSFCSSCLGGWLKRPGDKLPRCPICRQAVAAVGKNHALQGLIEGLLKAHPEKQRSLAALADLDSRDPLHDNGYDLGKLRGAGDAAAGLVRFTVAAAAAAEAMDAESESEHSDMDSDDLDFEAEPAHAWAEPGAVRPPCAKCGVPAWRPLRSAAEAAVSNPMAATALTKTALARNTFEEEILQEWLAAKGLSLLQAILDLLAAPNPVNAPAVRWHAAGAPPDFLASRDALTDLPSCNTCSQNILRGVVYSIRERISAEELPERARGRGNCWYGRCCRTQCHKRNHAERLNHICEQTRG